jgi:UDP:flavonoid glycosyltransferase YjiC (YdhE family)
VSPTVVFVTIPEGSHFALLEPLIAGTVEQGATVHVLGDRRNAAAVERAGAAFHDLYGPRPIEAVDDESVPLPSRFVTYAAAHADAVAGELEALAPDVIVHDVFAVLGRLVARELGVPRVAVAPGHDLDPRRIAEELRRAPYVAPSRRCCDAVEVLRTRYGLDDASPFAYLGGGSPELTVCCEPRPFLALDEQRDVADVVFYGSLPADAAARAAGARKRAGRARRASTAASLVVSFGTIIWRYYAEEALDALAAIADAVARDERVEATIGLGGAALDQARVAALERPGVRVLPWLDQWQELAGADAFVTHNGVASTHEAVLFGVPMLSVPFFGDQPRRAERCRALGLATPLVDTPAGPLRPERLRAALEGIGGGSRAGAAFDEARRWEEAALAGRDAVHRRIVDLAGVRLT